MPATFPEQPIPAAAAQEPPVLAAHPPLGAKAVSGAAWTLFFAAGNKVITFAGQIALAWLLVPQDMGLIAMALSFTLAASLLLLGGVGDVLVQRQERFEQDAPQVFWLSLTTSIAAGALVALCAPLGARLFDEPRVIPLIMIEALSWPLDGVSTVYGARLRKDLRFKPLALIQILAGFANTGAAVALAYAGFGVYALAFAPVARRIVSAIFLRVAAGKRPAGGPHPAQWPALLQPAMWLMLTTFFMALHQSAPNFVLGHYTNDAHEVGLLAWGTALSAQAVYLLATNLQNILFPTLAKLSAEPERQFNAVNQTVRMITAVLAPVCVLQIVTAEPLIKLAFKPEWLPAAPVVAWLSFGMLTQPMTVMAGALLKARGRFQTLAYLTGAQMAILAGACVIGAQGGTAASTASWLGGSLLTTGLLAGWVLYREYGHGLFHLAQTIGTPIAISAMTGITSWAVDKYLLGNSRILLVLTGLSATVILTYLILVRVFSPLLIHNIRFRANSIW